MAVYTAIAVARCEMGKKEREKKRRRGTNNKWIPWLTGFFIVRDTHARCFDSLAVSNNIRYFYHITATVRFVAFIRVGTRFGTRRLEISRDSRALLRLPLISRSRYIPLTLSTRHFMNERLSLCLLLFLSLFLDVRVRNEFNPRASFNGFVFPRNLSIQ